MLPLPGAPEDSGQVADVAAADEAAVAEEMTVQETTPMQAVVIGSESTPAVDTEGASAAVEALYRRSQTVQTFTSFLARQWTVAEEQTWIFAEEGEDENNGCCARNCARFSRKNSDGEFSSSRSRLPDFSRILDWVFGDVGGQLSALVAAAAFLILAGTAVWSWTGGSDDYDETWEQSMWLSWGLFFDPGTQTGIAADAPFRQKLVALVFSVFGFLYNLVMLGIIVEWIRSIMERMEKTRNRVWYNDHTLILGWSDKTLFMLNEIFEEIAVTGGRGKVVIVAEREEEEMNQEIQLHFAHMWNDVPFWDRRWQALRGLKIREGTTHDADILERANASRAKDIVVLGRDGDKRHADIDAVRIVVALCSLKENISGRILAEVQLPEVAKVLRRLHPASEVIYARSATVHILALMALKPVPGTCIIDLCSFSAGEELYVLELPQLVGKSFGEVCLTFDTGICIGVQANKTRKQAHNTRIHLAPSDSRKIEAGERILVLAKSLKDIQKFMPSTSSWHWRKPETKVQQTQLLAGNSQLFQNPVSRRGDKESKPEEDEVIRSPRMLQGRPLVIIGWPADMPELLGLLDGMIIRGTVVHVLSDATEAKRLQHLAGLQFQNIVLQHHYGARTAEHLLRQLPLEEAYSILILSQLQIKAEATDGLEIVDDDDVGDDSITSDAVCLTVVLVIADILGLKQRADILQHQKTGESTREEMGGQCKVLCEVLDARTQQVLARNKSLRGVAGFFRSKALETGLFTMAMSEPAVFNALMVMMSPACPNLEVVPLRTFLKKAEGVYSFWDLNRIVRDCDKSLLVGWHRTSQDGEHKLVPELAPNVDKNKELRWTPHDDLIIIKKPPKTKS